MAMWRVPDGEPVSVHWNARLRTTAGRAFMSESRIELNPHLLTAQPDEIPVVLVHEAAHIAVFRQFGPNVPAHGRHWRAFMRLAGLPPDVTHDLPVPSRIEPRRSWLYLRVCDACGRRKLGRSVRYGVCACGVEDRFMVLRGPADQVGLEQLRAVSIAEVRKRCGHLVRE